MISNGHVIIEDSTPTPTPSIATDDFLKKSLNMFEKTFKTGRHCNRSSVSSRRKRDITGTLNYCTDSTSFSASSSIIKHTKKRTCRSNIWESPLYLIGPDILSHCMSYLSPPEVLTFLTMPISKTFRKTFTSPEDTWRTLCVSAPFHANACEEEENDDDFFPYTPEHKFRTMYCSFVECYQYLKSLETHKNAPSENKFGDQKSSSDYFSKKAQIGQTQSIGLCEEKHQSHEEHELIELKDINASCAVVAIANWLVAFSDVLGIQTMCLKALTAIVEDEEQRVTALKSLGLTDIILDVMLKYADKVKVQVAALQVLVVLARPLGGREGMIFPRSHLNSLGIFCDPQNGISIILDSMKKFHHHAEMQAMGCWSLVNLALVPVQRTRLLQSGAIDVVLNAMGEHKLDQMVQFRALFALINLVIPCTKKRSSESSETHSSSEKSERQIVDELVEKIVDSVVTAMDNFTQDEPLIARSCIVLNNLSIIEHYRTTLLWSTGCYKMLHLIRRVYAHNNVVRRSVDGILDNLRQLLTKDRSLYTRFITFMKQTTEHSSAQNESM